MYFISGVSGTSYLTPDPQGGVLSQTGTDGATKYLLTDANGSTIGLLNAVTQALDGTASYSPTCQTTQSTGVQSVIGCESMVYMPGSATLYGSMDGAVYDSGQQMGLGGMQPLAARPDEGWGGLGWVLGHAGGTGGGSQIWPQGPEMGWHFPLCDTKWGDHGVKFLRQKPRYVSNPTEYYYAAAALMIQPLAGWISGYDIAQGQYKGRRVRCDLLHDWFDVGNFITSTIDNFHVPDHEISDYCRRGAENHGATYEQDWYPA